MHKLFPFSAIVGQEKLRTALLLNAINPSVGGVLIRGEKGTGKSTLARALADLLPPIDVVHGCPYQCDPSKPYENCPYCTQILQESGILPKVSRPPRVVNLPVNASEDRVCGTLDIEYTLRTGQKRFEPGILADAHRGILYIDEVNLLDNHIVDVLLDASAWGVNVVEREGVHMVHPSRFILIGTMNPEEGDLRPQLLDRFGLCVDVDGIFDAHDRAEIVRRKLKWEENPESVINQFKNEQIALTQKIVQAQESLRNVEIKDDDLLKISELCVRLKIHSHRADITIAQTAKTLAAWHGRTYIVHSDIEDAAELALPHRMRRRPFEDSKIDKEQITKVLNEIASLKNNNVTQEDNQDSNNRVFSIGDPVTFEFQKQSVKSNERTGKSPTRTISQKKGATIKTERPPETGIKMGDLAVEASLCAAVSNRHIINDGGLPISIKPEDIRVKKRESNTQSIILFVVDTSGSMGAYQRMSAAKGAVLGLLKDAYVHRNQIAMITFGKDKAEIILPVTNNLEQAKDILKNIPTGGKTPLAHALAKTLDVCQKILNQDKNVSIFVVLISDGNANVRYFQTPDSNPFNDAIIVAQELTALPVSLYVLDTENEFLNLGLAKTLADKVGAKYIKLSEIESRTIESVVRTNILVPN